MPKSIGIHRVDPEANFGQLGDSRRVGLGRPGWACAGLGRSGGLRGAKSSYFIVFLGLRGAKSSYFIVLLGLRGAKSLYFIVLLGLRGTPGQRGVC